MMDPQYQDESRRMADQADYDDQVAASQQNVQIIREMTYDKSIPMELTKKLWGLTSKFQVLSNIADVDERIMLRIFYMQKNDLLRSMCVTDITPELEIDLLNLEATYRANLTRAKGPNRERVLQQKQIIETISSTERGRGPEEKRGFFGVLGKIWGRKKSHQPEGAQA